jgi:stringent starvation protein B
VEEKKEKLLGALDKGKTQIHLDARRPGVIVPEAYRGDFHLVLDLSYRFDPPDLTVSEWGIRETLSFKGSRFTVGVPWSAVYAIASHQSREFWMYPDDMPKELLEGAVDRQFTAGPAEPAPQPGTPRAVLREVVMERAPGEGAVASGEPEAPTPPKRGHLRVVK